MLDAEGTALMQQRRYAEACPKLAESERLQPGTGVLLRLGLCDELLGKTASAWSAFREAAARAQRGGDEALRQLATKRADGLAPRVPRVRLVLSPGASREQVTVICDGAPLDPSALGVEIPMDPGEHAVEVSRAGRPVLRKAFTLAPQSALVTIELPLEEPGALGEGAVTADLGRTQRAFALVAGGVGVAGVAAGTFLGAAALSDWNRARRGCTRGTSGCSQESLDLQPTVRTDAAASTVAFAVGAAGLVGGAILWWTAPKSDAPRASAVVRPALGADRVGFELTGSF